MIELGNQQVLAGFRMLAIGYIERQALQSHEAPRGVELGLRRFLQPDFPAEFNTRDNLLTGGQTFVNGFRQVIGNMINGAP